MRWTLTGWLAAALAAGSGGPRAAGATGDDTLVLNERCYVRSYYRFDWDRICPGPLKDPEEAFVNAGELRSLERLTKARLAHQGIDWEKVDWRDRAVIRFVCPNAGIRPAPKAERHMNAPPPPAGWAAADFDDRSWPRQRKPFLIGKPALGFGVQNCGVRACFHRFCFEVPEPASAGELTLDLSYRGGVRVHLNGRKVAAAHITDDGLGEDYPLSAYVRTDAELSDRARERLQRWRKEPKRRWPAQSLFLPELFGRFDDQPHPHDRPDVARCHRGTTSVKRAVWDRIQTLRDRRLTVKLPAKRLRRGQNVLAIEVRASRFHPIVLRDWNGWGNFSWAHAQINRFEVRRASGKVPSMLRRPGGMQVWAPDPHHRVHDTEWGPRTGEPPTVRFVAARNGTYSAQIAVGCDRPLRDLRVAAGELAGPSGAIPASAVEVVHMRPRPLTDLAGLIGGRSKTLGDPVKGGLRALRRHGLIDVDPLSREQKLAAMARLHFFDHIDPAIARPGVPADRCRAVWLYLKVPASAPAGRYTGEVTVSAKGVRPVQVAVEAEVVAWRVPHPKRFQTVMALEQSPYGVAKQYGVIPWSDEHLALLAGSIRQLARAGNDWAFVPVLRYSEFGNRTDSPIRFIRGDDGRLRYDYSRLDRYLDLLVEHWGTEPPKIIVFCVLHGNPKNPPEVTVLDERTGRTGARPVAGASLTKADRRRFWGDFGIDLYNHMKACGLAHAMFWGYAWDGEGDSGLKFLLEEFTPGVWWAMGGHALRTHPKYYRAYSWIYKVHSSLSLMHNCMGWRNPKLEFQNPRGGGSVLRLPGNAPAFGFRLAIQRALTAGCRGLGRVGADYWKESYYDGTRGGEVYLQPGMNTHVLLWPGRDGADSSARFEAMIEGLQEAEARIFLEQMLLRRILPKALHARVEAALTDHLASTVYIPAGVQARRFFDYAGPGWRPHSRRLYVMAAEVAATVGLDVDRTELAADLPPRAPRTVRLALRNWTGKPRAWRASVDRPWIRPVRTEATAAGQTDLAVVLDPRDLPPGRTAEGRLLITDAAGGTTYTVAVTADVAEVFRLSLNEAVLNVPAGASAARAVTLFNTSGAELAWSSEASADWLTLEPAAGRLPAGEAALITVRARGGRAAADLKATATVAAAGAAPKALTVRALVIPPYRRPEPPAGKPIGLHTPAGRKHIEHTLMHTAGDPIRQKWFRQQDRWKQPQFRQGFYSPRVKLEGYAKAYETALWLKPRGEARLDVSGGGFAAFSAEVGMPPGCQPEAAMSFEVYVDGDLRTQSGLMRTGDPPRLLVVRGLAKAKTVTLVNRMSDLHDNEHCIGFWADPCFYGK